MRKFAQSLALEASRADDVLQDAMLAAWRAWPRWTPQDPDDVEVSARAWLYKIVTRRFMMTHRGQKRLARREAAAVQHAELMGDVEYVTQTLHELRNAHATEGRGTCLAPCAPTSEYAPDPVDEHVLNALTRLSHERRQVIVMHYLEGKTLDQIAAETGVARATVGTRLNRARKCLEKLLKKHAIRCGLVVETA